MWKKWFSVGVLVVLLLTGASAVQARELAGKNFGGKGWNQSDLGASVPVPVSFAGVSRGSISFDLQRTGDIPAGEGETVFALMESAGILALRLQVDWKSETEPGNPKFYFRGPGNGEEYRRYGIGLWGPTIELDRPVARGAWIHVDLTWDDTARKYAIYVDGREQLRKSGGFDPGKFFSPEMLEKVNRELEREGKPKAFDSRPLGAFLSEVVSVQLGNHGPPRAPGRRRPYLRNALLDNFVVYGDEIPPPGGTRLSAAMAIATVEHDAARVAGFSGKLVAGDTLQVTVSGTPGAAGSFDIAHYPDLDRTIELDWRGWGVYLEEKVFYEPGEVNLRDVEGYRVYVGTSPIDPAAPGIEPLERLDVKVQNYKVESLEIGTPYYVAVLAEMRDGTLRKVLATSTGLPLAETEPGVYTGTWQVTYRDHYPRALVVGHLALAPAVATLAADARSAFVVDPALTIAVATSPQELKADEKSVANVSVTVTDANGKAVPGHEIKFLLATTSQYTGVVGGGAFAEQVGGSLKEIAFGETDLFGKISATYVAGFAAKTAVIVARDMVADSTGAGYVRTYIQSSAELELLPVEPPAAADEGYAITVSSSDDWLTADGRSEARITAKVTLAGKPVEGHEVSFSATAGSGSIRVVKGTTGRDGEARAVYTAGRKIGLVLITATDTTAGLSGSVQIELRSDAPAKIAIKLDPEKIPADGRSTATLQVTVTDVNDNPNDNTEVEYRIASGGGRLRDEKGLTDRRGENSTDYVAGLSPGKVSIEITVRSAVPAAEEMTQARSLALAVPDSRFF